MPIGKQVMWFVATAAEWAEANEVLETNYIGLESDTGRAKLGDAETAWNDLVYLDGGAAVPVVSSEEPLFAES